MNKRQRMLVRMSGRASVKPGGTTGSYAPVPAICNCRDRSFFEGSLPPQAVRAAAAPQAAAAARKERRVILRIMMISSIFSPSFGENVTFDFQNAQGDSATCATIANGFVSSGVALIMANATPALQAAQAATNTIPILGTSVTDYASALEIDNWNGTVGTNVSGTSDLAPLDQQAAMLRELFPDAKTVSLLYCSAEANSQYQVDKVTEYLEVKGITANQYAFSDSNDLSSVCQQAANENDALYVPTDNTVAANTGIVDGICRPAKKPVFAGEEGICSGCGVATLSIPFPVPAGHHASAFHALYVSDTGDVEQLATRYEAGKLHWNVGHFSDFMIVYDENKVNPDTGSDSSTKEALLTIARTVAWIVTSYSSNAIPAKRIVGYDLFWYNGNIL